MRTFAAGEHDSGVPPDRRRGTNKHVLTFALLACAAVSTLAGLWFVFRQSSSEPQAWVDRFGPRLPAVVRLYRLHVGAYPPSLEALVAPPSEDPALAERWQGPYV